MMKSKTSTPTPNRFDKGRVLAIDPGFDRIGVAIMEDNQLLFSDCIETNRKETHEKRLEQIGQSLKKITKKWQPEKLAIEKLFFNANAPTALRVSEARGVILYEAALAKLEVFEYSPQAIKIACTGYGKASKKQTGDMAMRLVGLKKSPKYDDELDAIAIGITYLSTAR